MNIKEYIQKSIKTKENILADDSIIQIIENSADTIVKAYKSGNKVLAAGNGGSAADAQHLAGELVVKFFKDRPALNALSLETNPSVMTAIGNDFGYDDVFARQVQANGIKGDVLIAISTSGNSKNIIKAINMAKTIGLSVIGLTGKKQCKMDKICDYLIKVPSEITPIIQESQIMVCHILCDLVEEKLFE